MSKFEELVEKAKENVQRMFDERGEILPMWHAQTVDGEDLILATPLGDADQKELLSQALKLFFQEKGVVRYVFMTETWFKAVKEGETMFSGDVRHQPDKKEAVMLVGEDRDTGASIMVQLEIDRSKGKAVLLPASNHNGGVAGRFTNMFGEPTQH